jgi:hypothetical protein
MARLFIFDAAASPWKPRRLCPSGDPASLSCKEILDKPRRLCGSVFQDDGKICAVMFNLLPILMGLFLLLMPLPAEARFTMDKYKYTREIFTDDLLTQDLNVINNYVQKRRGPYFITAYRKKLKEADPNIHPVDLQRQADARQEEYFNASGKRMADSAKSLGESETMFVIESFTPIQLERMRNFFRDYPKLSYVLPSLSNYLTFTRSIHAIYSKDHRDRWEVAADISKLLLDNQPVYMDFSTADRENAVYNNMVNYLTNNFNPKELAEIRDYLASSVGVKLRQVTYRIFTDRVRMVEDIYKGYEKIYSELPEEKSDGKDSH